VLSKPLVTWFVIFQRLVSVGLDTHATINVWDWKKGKVIATVRGHSDRVSRFRNHYHIV